MTTRREIPDADDRGARGYVPTTERVGANRHEVHCAECGGLFFVDDAAYDRIREASDVDPSGTLFLCLECEADYGDEEPGR